LREVDLYLRHGLLGDGDLTSVVEDADDDGAAVFTETHEALAHDLIGVIGLGVLLDKLTVDDDDGLRAGGVFLVEVAAAKHGEAEDALSVGVDGAELSTNIATANGVSGVSFGGEGEDHVEVMTEGDFGHEGCGFDAGQSANALEQGRVEGGVEVLIAEAVRGNGHAANEDVVRTEAEGDMAESIDGAEKEAAGDEENEGEGDLGDDQERAGTVLGPTDAGLRRCLTEGGFDRGASAGDCGPECGYSALKRVRVRSTAMDRQPGVA